MLWKAKEARSGVLYMISTNKMLGTSIKRRAFNQEARIIHIDVNKGMFFLMVTVKNRLPWRSISLSPNRVLIFQVRNTRI